MLTTVSVQISWHNWEVLWRDWHVGDRRGDAHQSQLAQLCVSPAEEGHSHEQHSRDPERQLSEGARGGNVSWLLSPTLGDGALQSSALWRTANWEEMPVFGAAVFELLLMAKSSLVFKLVTACVVSLTQLGPCFALGNKGNVAHESQVIDWLIGVSVCSLNSLSLWCEHG